MAGKNRHLDLRGLYMLTTRFEHGRHHLLPDGKRYCVRRCRPDMQIPEELLQTTAQIQIACLTRAAERHDIEIFAFGAVSNHHHTIIRSPEGHLVDFMRDYNSTLVRSLQRVLDWNTRMIRTTFDDILLDGPEAFLDEMAYVLANACHHDLVDFPGQWAGASSWQATLPGNPHRVCGTWVDNDIWRSMLRARDLSNLDVERALVRHIVELGRPGFWPGLTDEQYFAMVVAHTYRYCERQIARRARLHRRAAGMALVSEGSTTATSPMPNTRPSRGIHSGGEDEEQRVEQFVAIDATAQAEFSAALEEVLSGRATHEEAGFPQGTYPNGAGGVHIDPERDLFEGWRREAVEVRRGWRPPTRRGDEDFDPADYPELAGFEHSPCVDPHGPQGGYLDSS